MTLTSRPLLVIEADVTAPVEVGDPGGGLRRYIPIVGGVVSGEVTGRILPGGVDWQTVLPGGVIELRAHYALETDAGDRIEVTAEGVRAGPPEVMARLGRGETVAPSEYYFRTHMRFRTGSSVHGRLNTVLAVGVAERMPTHVRIASYEIL